MDSQSVINWTVVGQLSWQCLRAPTLDHCSFITGDRQALSTVQYSRAGQLATADTCYMYDIDYLLTLNVTLIHDVGGIASCPLLLMQVTVGMVEEGEQLAR